MVALICPETAEVGIRPTGALVPSGDTKVLFKLLQTFHTLFGRGSMTIYKALGMY